MVQLELGNKYKNYLPKLPSPWHPESKQPDAQGLGTVGVAVCEGSWAGTREPGPAVAQQLRPRPLASAPQLRL